MRKLILFLTLALLVMAFTVPAFATENDDIVCEMPFSSGCGSVETLVPPGTYGVKVCIDDIVVLSDTVIFTEYPHYYTKEFNYDGVTWEVEITFTSQGVSCYFEDPAFIEMFGYEGVVLVFTSAPEPDPVSPSAGVLSVFTSIGAYLISGLTSLLALFWTGTSLTFLGVLAVCALAIAVILLLVLLIIRNARGY